MNHHEQVMKPWGSYRVLSNKDRYKVKIIEVKPLQRISLQRHSKREEHWIIVQGLAKVTLNKNLHTLQLGDSIIIKQKDIHRVENPSATTTLLFIEVQIGYYLEEDDIERFEDDYGRIK